MLRRIASLLVVLWVLGFVAFAVTLPRPADDTHADAVIVLTGGEGRVDRGLATLRHHWAQRLLVSGVDSEVKPAEFAAQYKVAPALMKCCITLGYESVDTRSNAKEAAEWVAAHNIHSMRLVTSDWHMRRAAWELRQAIPASVTIIDDAVTSRPSLNTLFIEYCKLLLRRGWRVANQIRALL